MKTNEELFEELYKKRCYKDDPFNWHETSLVTLEIRSTFLAACEIKDKELERLQRELASIIENNNYHANQMIKLKEQNKKLRECEEWYADRKNCDNPDFSHIAEIDRFGEEIADGGYLARKCLEEIEKL